MSFNSSNTSSTSVIDKAEAAKMVDQVKDDSSSQRNQTLCQQQNWTQFNYSGNRNSSNGIRNHRRHHYTTAQLIVLEHHYQRNNHLTHRKTLELCRSLNLLEKHVKAWFQNRRMKEKIASALCLLASSDASYRRENQALYTVKNTELVNRLLSFSPWLCKRNNTRQYQRATTSSPVEEETDNYHYTIPVSNNSQRNDYTELENQFSEDHTLQMVPEHPNYSYDE